MNTFKFRLDSEYIDLYLIHSAFGGKLLKTYDAMLDLKKEGLIRCLKWLKIMPLYSFLR